MLCSAPPEWRPGQGGPPPNTDDGDSEGESGDEGDIKSPFKIDGYNISGYDTIGAAGESESKGSANSNENPKPPYILHLPTPLSPAPAFLLLPLLLTSCLGLTE